MEDLGVCVVGNGSKSSSTSPLDVSGWWLLNGVGGRLECEGIGVPGAAVDDKLRRSEYRDRRRYLRHEKKRENLVYSTVSVVEHQKRIRARHANLASIRAAVSAPSVVDIVRPPASTFLDALNANVTVPEHVEVSCQV